MRVLICEDQDLIRKGLVKIAGEVEGIEIEEAADGEEAWDAFSRFPADLLVTDIVMPRMDGLTLIERASAAMGGCAAIVISGHEKFVYAQRAMSWGVRDYLLKPVHREAFKRAIQEHGEEHARTRAHEQKLFRAMWDACATGNNYTLRDELLGTTIPVAGRFVVARGDAGSRPRADGVGWSLSRKLADIGEDMALFAAYGEYDASRRTVGVTALDEPFDAETDVFQCVRHLAERWNGNGKYDQAIRIAVAYIQEHYAENISLREVAKHVYLHPNYLSALFTRNCGCGFVRYLQNLRIERACALLHNTNMKIHEIAASVGFTSERYFIHVFKAATGATPQTYRLSKLNGCAEYEGRGAPAKRD